MLEKSTKQKFSRQQHNNPLDSPSCGTSPLANTSKSDRPLTYSHIHPHKPTLYKTALSQPRGALSVSSELQCAIARPIRLATRR